MYCNNCGHELSEQVDFCPQCGQKVGAKVAPNKEEKTNPTTAATNSNLSWIKHRPSKIKIMTLLGSLIAIVAVVFFSYHLIYLPKVVTKAVNSDTEFRSYPVEANVYSKTLMIKIDRAKAIRLIDAASDNGFAMGKIGMEEQLAVLNKDLPGNWTIQVIQTSDSNSPRVLWGYANGVENVRYQNSNEFKQAREAYLAAKAKQDATASDVDTAVKGAVIGGLLGSALRRW